MATFAGGCFWCLQHDLDLQEGVVKTIVGYTGGKTAHPTYQEVCKGTTGHIEAIELLFDPEKISYEKLLEVYWHSIDPTTNEGQFCDIGTQYRPVIYYHNEEQKWLAEESKKAIMKNEKIYVAVDIRPATDFYPAEEYHQHYYKKEPIRYKLYSENSGRDEKLREIWGK